MIIMWIKKSINHQTNLYAQFLCWKSTYKYTHFNYFIIAFLVVRRERTGKKFTDYCLDDFSRCSVLGTRTVVFFNKNDMKSNAIIIFKWKSNKNIERFSIHRSAKYEWSYAIEKMQLQWTCIHSREKCSISIPLQWNEFFFKFVIKICDLWMNCVHLRPQTSNLIFQFKSMSIITLLNIGQVSLTRKKKIRPKNPLTLYVLKWREKNTITVEKTKNFITVDRKRNL